MRAADSLSHQVYVGSDVVVKIIDAVGHSRLDREVALAPHLPTGITAPLLGSGLHRPGTREEVRYACYAREQGTTPGIGLPRIADEATARTLAEAAVERLVRLHSWTPTARAARTLREPLDHGGFTGRAALLAEAETLRALDRQGLIAPVSSTAWPPSRSARRRTLGPTYPCMPTATGTTGSRTAVR